MRTLLSLKICNQHLSTLYDALQKGDVDTVYEVEHTLTREEECVACTYVLHTRGKARDMLEDYLEKEGVGIVSKPLTFSQEITFWLGRFILLGFLFICLWQAGIVVKKFIFEMPQMNSLGTFGLMGVLIGTLAIYTVIEYWIIE